MGEYLDRPEDELGINASHMKILTLVFGLVLGAHLMACVSSVHSDTCLPRARLAMIEPFGSSNNHVCKLV